MSEKLKVIDGRDLYLSLFIHNANMMAGICARQGALVHGELESAQLLSNEIHNDYHEFSKALNDIMTAEQIDGGKDKPQ